MSTPAPNPAPPAIDERARMRLKRHFPSYNWDLYPEAMVMAGVICVIFGVYYPQQLVNMILLFIVLAGSGGGWKYWRSLYVASEKEFDQIAEADYAGIQHYALQRFELTPADLRDPEPCKFRRGPPKLAVPDNLHVHKGSRMGSDEATRQTPMEYVVVNFGHAELFIYRCVWDLTSGTTVVEETHDISYRDIVCVELTHEKVAIRININTKPLIPLWEKHGIKPVNKWLQVPNSESVKLRLAQGEELAIFDWKRSTGVGTPSGAGVKHFLAAQRMQKLVRDFKQPPPKAAKTAPASAPAPKALPTIRHMRRTSSSS